MAKKKQLKTSITLSGLRSKYEGSGVVADIQVDEDQELWVPSSSPVLNYYLGGGAAYGRIIEISGKESSGKSLMCLDFIRSAQAMGGVGIYVDAEFAFSTPWAEANGLDMSKIYLYQENSIELISDFTAEACLYYRSQLTANEPIVLVLDSVAAMDTMAAMSTSEADSKAEMGGRAKALYKLLRLRNRLWAKLGITVIFINQLRDTIATGFAAKFEEKVTTPGGNALKFYASQRIYLEAKKQLVAGSGDRKHRYGVEVLLTVKKNKLSIPKVPTRISVIFDPDYGTLGFDRYTGLEDILIKEATVSRSGNSYMLEEEKIASSLQELISVIKKDKEVRAKLLLSAGIKTVSYMVDLLEDIEENRYPTDGVVFVQQSKSDKEEDEDDDE